MAAARAAVAADGVSVVHACADEDGKGLTDTGTTEAGAGRVCAGEGVWEAAGGVPCERTPHVEGRGERKDGDDAQHAALPAAPLLRCSAAPLLRCSFGPHPRGAGCNMLKMLKKLCSTGMMDF